jgi:hypothetical protein
MHAGQSICIGISMIKFELALENDRWLNIAEFVKFCRDHENQDIIIDVINEGHCLQYCGVYDILEKFNFSSVKIHTSNALEHHPFYQIERRWDIWLKNTKLFDNDFDYTWNQEKIFGCFYGRPSAPRLGIAAHLLSQYRDKSFVVTKFDFSNEDERQNFDIKRLFTWHPDSLRNLFLLQTNSTGKSIGYIKGQYPTNELSKEYKNFLIDIVSEPSCSGNAFYPTEKIFRAIFCKRPFIVMGNKDYLLYLRQLGFKTFYEVWDEDYDGFDEKLRYVKILKLIDQIGSLDQNKIQNLYQNMQHVIEHNHQLLKTRSYQRVITKVSDDY